MQHIVLSRHLSSTRHISSTRHLSHPLTKDLSHLVTIHQMCCTLLIHPTHATSQLDLRAVRNGCRLIHYGLPLRGPTGRRRWHWSPFALCSGRQPTAVGVHDTGGRGRGGFLHWGVPFCRRCFFMHGAVWLSNLPSLLLQVPVLGGALS